MEQKNIIDCYDRTAAQYAHKFSHELDYKHLDRILLKAFASENRARGRMIDLGCGPGQTTAFLHGCGTGDILGTDLSPAMVHEAKARHPGIAFETADMLALGYPDDSFGSAVAFYATVHFTEEQLLAALKQLSRVLVPGGQFLFSFHAGTETVHLDEFLGESVNIDFRFFESARVLELLGHAGFEVITALERMPYPEVEYPSKRAYIWAGKAG